jgi:hypothetical protein
VAREVGVDGPAGSDDLGDWPIPYRLGVAEGLTLSSAGLLSMDRGWVGTDVDVLLPVPPKQLKAFVTDLADTVAASGVTPSFVDAGSV